MPVTFTENVHDELADSTAPDKLITLVPCVAVIVPPPQEPVRPLGVEITSPPGRVSRNPIPVSVVEVFGLFRVKLSDVVPLSGRLVAPNALETDGGVKTVRLMKVTVVWAPALTVTVAVPVPRLLLTSNPAGDVLTPASTVPAGIVSMITAVPAGTVIGVPQVPPGAGPAGTITGVPATSKVKFVPTVIPVPATLQMLRVPTTCECTPVAQSTTTDARNKDLTRIMGLMFMIASSSMGDDRNPSGIIGQTGNNLLWDDLNFSKKGVVCQEK